MQGKLKPPDEYLDHGRFLVSRGFSFEFAAVHIGANRPEVFGCYAVVNRLGEALGETRHRLYRGLDAPTGTAFERTDQ